MLRLSRSNAIRSMSTTAAAPAAHFGLYVAVDSKGAIVSKELSADSSLKSIDVSKLWAVSKATEKAGESRVFYDVDGATVVAISTGKPAAAATNEQAENKLKEISRRTAALGLLSLKQQNATKLAIDGLYSPHSAAVGSTLASWNWNLKTTSAAKALLQPVDIECLGSTTSDLATEQAVSDRIALDWSTGVVYGQAQNMARELMELPANLMTPTIFCDRAVKKLAGLANVKAEVHDLAWAESKNMGSFISVSRGSAQPLRFFEAHYKGAASKDSAPLALVGKGITFDSGGISIKPAASMDDMRGDMGGAATTFSAFWAIATLKLPINVSLYIPLTENLIGPSATKPGDNVVAGNGVTINVINTDAEGRLVLADALFYASSQSPRPHTLIDAATLTGAIGVALGDQYAGVFTNSDSLFSEIDAAAKSENDSVWRMPLSEGYMKQINNKDADLSNTGGRAAGACTAAIFLKRFVNGLIIDGTDNPEQEDLIRYAHVDIAGVMDTTSNDAYTRAGMTGRPVRTFIEFARRSAKSE